MRMSSKTATTSRWSRNEGLADEWIDGQDRMDRMLAPFGDRLVAQAALLPGEAVIDVGCGTGSTILAGWKYVAPTGSITGVDVPTAMLAAAAVRLRRRVDAERVHLVEADAATHTFPARFADVIVSR